MAAPLIVRLVMDAGNYLRTVDTAVASNTKLDESLIGVGQSASIAADKQVAASLRATKALEGQIAGYRALAADATATAETQERAALLATRAQQRLNAQLGVGAIATAGAGNATRTAERDLGKLTRGTLAGSGAVAGMGRSLAFASSGFLAFAAGATLISRSIIQAENLAKAQESLGVAIRHTGGNVARLQPLYAATAKAAAQFGISEADATTGLARATVLTGNASRAQRAYQEALVISKATGKDFNAVLTATAKGQEGVTTSLRRYGILVSTGEKGTAQFAQVMARFGGQAAANTTAMDKLHAALANAEATIGTALLPTFDRLVTSLSAWLTKMEQTGRLQRDVSEGLHIVGTAFHVVEVAVKAVDTVTGGFVKTLEILAAFKFASLVAGWVGNLGTLATAWKGVGAAATAATGAEGAAGVAGGAAAGGASRVILPPGVAAGATAAGEGGAALLGARLAGLRAVPIAIPIPDQLSTTSKIVNGWEFVSIDGGKHWIRGRYVGYSVTIAPQLKSFPQTGQLVPSQFLAPGFGRASTGRPPPAASGPFGSATPLAVYASYSQTISQQIAAAQAALTKTTKDDVAAAKGVIARIKRLIANGHLAGASLVQALQDEATQESVLANARQAAAQQAAKIAAAKKAAASSYQTPIDLQLAEARAQLTASTADDIRAEKQILAAAKAAVASGRKNKQGILAALQVELQAQQAIQSLTQQTNATFTVPAKLALDIARDQALGKGITDDLLQERKALYRWIAAHRKNIQGVTDAYNQIAAINQQLGSDAQTAFGNYKQGSLAAETAGLDLSRTARKILQARLSQRGPGGTTPGTGTGAGGYIIGPDGRPVQVHRHRHTHNGRDITGSGGDARPQLHATFNIRVYLDGHDVTRSVTIRQQKTRDRNPSQRRGPHAGKTTA